MIDPVSGATVHARYALIPPRGEKLLPPRPLLRSLKCVWQGEITLKKLCRILNRVLTRAKADLDYFAPQWGYRYQELTGNEKWCDLWKFKGRRYRWVACYAVTGANEGHYIHVELTGYNNDDNETPIRLLLWNGKTFSGYEHACAVAKLVGALLGA